MEPDFRSLRFSAALLVLAVPRFASAEEPPKAGAVPVTVVLHADDPRATIERRASSESLFAVPPFKDAGLLSVARWEPSCTVPCNVALDPRFTYRVAGDGLVPSDTFTLPSDREPLQLDARMGAANARLGGLALIGVGVAGAALGGAALVASPILESQDVGSRTFRTGLLAGGAIVAGAGAIALVSGLWLWLSNDTRVRREARGLAF